MHYLLVGLGCLQLSQCKLYAGSDPTYVTAMHPAVALTSCPLMCGPLSSPFDADPCRGVRPRLSIIPRSWSAKKHNTLTLHQFQVISCIVDISSDALI